LADYLLPDTTTKAVFNIPARLSLSYFSEINDKIDMMFDYTFIKSSVMDELSVGFGVEEDSNGNKVVLADAKIPLKWQDSYKVSLGLNYHLMIKQPLRLAFNMIKHQFHQRNLDILRSLKAIDIWHRWASIIK